ncbi:Odorant receptor [Sergentomyia squamirostris]
MDNICETNKKLLNWSGFWFEGDSVKYHQTLRIIVCFLAAIVLVVSPEMFCIYQNRKNLMEVTRVTSECLTNTLCTIKMIVVYRNREKLRQLFNEMQTEWNISAVAAVKEKSMNRAEFISKGFGYSYLFFATNFMINPLITEIITSHVKNETLSLKQMPFPIKLEFPFDSRRDVTTYTAIFSITFAAILVCQIILMGFDTLFIALMNHCGDFFKILGVNLKEIQNNNLQPDSESDQVGSDMDAQKYLNNLKVIVHKHNKYIDFTYRLEEILNLVMLAQYLASTFMFCIVGFQLSILLKTPYDFCILLTYCGCLGTQLFLFSWFGSYLTTSSFDVSLTAYECGWYDAPVQFQKEIIFIIQRSHRPLGITASKFYYISVESFANTVSAAMSYFTLLHSLYEE